MSMTYATIAGKITKPGSNIGIRAKVTATPLTTNKAIKFPTEDRMTWGPETAETDSSGDLGSRLKIPTNHGLTELYWQFTAEPLDKVPGLSKWTMGTFEITESTRLEDLVDVDVLTVNPELVVNIADLVADAEAAEAAAGTSATAAQGWADAASSSAADADTSADLAAGSATSASGSASTATTKAGEASASATAAAGSATAAATSETNAAASESAAATSETNAAASETAAAGYAASAAGSVSLVAWAPATAYAAGDVRQAPDGSTIRRLANGTSGASFDTTEEAAWEAVLGNATTIDGKALSASTADAIQAQVLDFAAVQTTTGPRPSTTLDPNPADNPTLYTDSITNWVAAQGTMARVADAGPNGEHVVEITFGSDPGDGAGNYGPRADKIACPELTYSVSGFDLQMPVDITASLYMAFYSGTAEGSIISASELAFTMTAGQWRTLRIGDWAPPGTNYKAILLRITSHTPLSAGDVVRMTKIFHSKSYYAPYNDDQTPVGNLSGFVNCLGDSITQGNHGTGQPYPAHLEDLLADLGVQVNNLGRGGESSAGIALRASAFQPLVTFPGDQIPADTSTVAVTLSPSAHYNAAAFTYKCEIAGVPGTLTITGGSATFARRWAGTAVDLLPGGTPVLIPYDGWSDLLIVEAGPNDIDSGTVAGVVQAVGAIVEQRRQIGRPYLVLGLLNKSTEPDGSSGHTFVTTANAALARLLGSQFLDIRTYLIQHGLTVAGITPTSDDTAAIAVDKIPPSLMYTDGIHPNDAGRLVIAKYIEQFVRARIQGLGLQGQPTPDVSSVPNGSWIKPWYAFGNPAAWAGAQRATFVRFQLTEQTVWRYLNWVCSVQSGNVQVGVVKLSGSGHTAYTRVMDSGVIACPAAGQIRTDLGATVLDPGDYALFMWADNTTFQTRRGTDASATVTKGAAIVNSLATGVPTSGSLGYSQEIVALSMEGDY